LCRDKSRLLTSKTQKTFIEIVLFRINNFRPHSILKYTSKKNQKYSKRILKMLVTVSFEVGGVLNVWDNWKSFNCVITLIFLKEKQLLNTVSLSVKLRKSSVENGWKRKYYVSDIIVLSKVMRFKIWNATFYHWNWQVSYSNVKVRKS